MQIRDSCHNSGRLVAQPINAQDRKGVDVVCFIHVYRKEQVLSLRHGEGANEWPRSNPKVASDEKDRPTWLGDSRKGAGSIQHRVVVRGNWQDPFPPFGTPFANGLAIDQRVVWKDLSSCVMNEAEQKQY